MSSYKEVADRRSRAYSLIMENGSLSVDRLSILLAVSKMTVRRDLAYLIRRGRIERTHGGAARKRTSKSEPPYVIRSSESRKEKQAIGATAAGQIRNRDVILVDVGSTLLELARHLNPASEITVVTNWIPVALECVKIGNQKIVLLGGDVDQQELSLTGAHPESILTNYIADAFFMGVGGVSLEFGLTDYKMEEIMVKRYMIRCAKKVIVLADHTKIGRVAPIKICDLSAVHTLIVDAGIGDHHRIALERRGIKVLVASEEVATTKRPVSENRLTDLRVAEATDERFDGSG